MKHCIPCLLLLAGLAGAAPALAVEIQLPPETATFKPSSLPGYALVQRNCMTCHSVHYIQTQPPTMTRTNWEATVKKMKKPYGAQFSDADIPAMVDYLSKVYGAERSGADAAAPASPQAPATHGGAAVSAGATNPRGAGN